MAKKYLGILFCVLVLGGCGSGDKWAGLFLYNRQDPFVDLFARQLLNEMDREVKLEVFDSQNSQIIQNEYIESIIDRRPDLLILNPVDRLGVYPIIRKLKAENVPVILFNREPLPKDMALWERAYYVGARAEQSGRMQAELIMELFGGDPRSLNEYDLNGDDRIQAVILKGEQGHQDAEIRTAEVVRAFKQAGFDLEILLTEVANWSREEAYEKAGRILELPGAEVLLSNNDAMALGVIDRMQKEGVDEWVPIVGIDGLDEAVERIQDGSLYGTVLNDSQAQSEAIAALTRFILEGEDPGELPFPLEKGQYVWIDYRPFTLDR